MATSGLPRGTADALSGVMDISAKDLLSKSEGGVGLSVLGLTSYVGVPARGIGSFVGSYDRGYSDMLTELNSREGERDFRTEHAFGKFHIQIDKSNQVRFTASTMVTGMTRSAASASLRRTVSGRCPGRRRRPATSPRLLTASATPTT